MNEKPVVKQFEDGSKIWSNTFDTFRAKVYIPETKLPEQIINYGFDAPYLLVFEENEMDEKTAKEYADNNGLAGIASANAGSVVFIYPVCEGGWKNADETLYIDLIANSKIHEYHEDGYAILNNRFTHSCDGYAIRGAIFRTFLFGCGESADYIASKLLKPIQGEGLWGPADVTPTACVLEKISNTPVFGRYDIPIVSIGNSVEINEDILDTVDDGYVLGEPDYTLIYNEFLKYYKRWGWVGTLMESPDLDELGMTEEAGIVSVKTSSDNNSDYRNTVEHEVGYLAYYNKNLFEKGAAPLVLCFHGGGDSAKHIAKSSEWYKVAMDHDFLLVCIENHLNSTATEMMELLEHLKTRYDIDTTRIYATGFSMGGCKSWDMYQEYPQVFAGLAPMDATFDVGCNIYGDKVQKEINKDIAVPIIYTGGEETPLPELPFQAQKCLDRMVYVLEVNKTVKQNPAVLEDKDNWSNPIWGIDGDRIEKVYDDSRDSTLTLHYFDSQDGRCITAFGSISGQGHECRYHTCEQSWLFMSKFRRLENGEIEINE